MRVNTLYFFVHSEPSLAEKKALATAVSKQEAAQRLLGQCYCRLVLGLGLEDKHHLGCGRYDPPEGGTLDFKRQGLLNRGKNQNPKKSLDQTLTVKKSHAEFPSRKNFQKALYDITRKIEALVLNPQKPLLQSSYPKKYLPKFSYPKKPQNRKFQTQKNPSVIPVTWNPEYPTWVWSIRNFSNNYFIMTGCPSIISTSPKNILMSRLISQFFYNNYLNSSKNFTYPSGK